MTNNQGITYNTKIDQSYLNRLMGEIVGIEPHRNFMNTESLEATASIIKRELANFGYEPIEQSYYVNGNQYKNIVATYGPVEAPRFVVGAHYDVCGDQQGADDNASGVVGLLEIAKLFKINNPNLNYRIDFVAFTLEEPPFFRSQKMGSYVYAKSLYENKINVIGMVSLEMIGYFSNKPKSQNYPLSIMRIFYPSKGNFIGVVGNFKSSKLVKHFKKNMKKSSIEVVSLKAPSFFGGIDFSDHLNFWKFSYPAVMITDTSFYRNRNYHSESDTIDTINFQKMAEVIKGCYIALLAIEIKTYNK